MKPNHLSHIPIKEFEKIIVDAGIPTRRIGLIKEQRKQIDSSSIEYYKC